MFAMRIGRIGYILGVFYLSVMVGAYIVFANLLIASASYLPLKGVFAVVFVVILGPLLYLFRVAFVLLIITCPISLFIRRLHDMNLSGWLWLLLFIPLVDVLLLLGIVFKPGTRGPNNYGMPMRELGLLKILGFK
jgi:uncharacterized membrane protein YhaH (DUF805 family)